jgi:hypothetical protein
MGGVDYRHLFFPSLQAGSLKSGYTFSLFSPLEEGEKREREKGGEGKHIVY